MDTFINEFFIKKLYKVSKVCTECENFLALVLTFEVPLAKSLIVTLTSWLKKKKKNPP